VFPGGVAQLVERHVRNVEVGGSSPLTSTGRATCGYMCYSSRVSGSISVRDLRNTVSEVLRRVEGGERLTVTVDRRPVAEIVPLHRRRTVSAADALAIASRHAADRGLLGDVRGLLPDTTDDL
jgi:prevent-host-death family protein